MSTGFINAATTVVAGPGEKVCRECNTAKLLADFYAHNQTSDGYFNECKKCVLKRRKKKYDERKAITIAQSKLDRVQKFVQGVLDLSELDDDEVFGTFIRDSDGDPVHMQDLAKTITPKIKKEGTRRLNAYLLSKAPATIKIIFEIAESNLVEPETRLKAATWLTERIIGRTPETLLIGHREDLPYESIMEQMEGGSREQYRQSQKAIENGNVVDAEVVEDSGLSSNDSNDVQSTTKTGGLPFHDSGKNDNGNKTRTTLDHANALAAKAAEIKAAKERINKARRARFAARAQGVSSVDLLHWDVNFTPILETDVLMDLITDGLPHAIRSLWRACLVPPGG